MDAADGYQAELQRAVREASIHVVGYQCVGNEAHARTVIAVLRAFGDERFGLVYVEPVLRSTTKRPPDVLLCHPDVGVVILEVKGWSIQAIERVEAGNFFVRQNGQLRVHNPFHQAAECMFQVKRQVEKVLRGSPAPLFSFVVVLPNVTLDEWTRRGVDQCVQHAQLLLADSLQDAQKLRDSLLKAIGKRPRRELSAEELAALQRAFGSSAPLRRRRDARHHVPQQTLGHEIDEFMNGLKVFSKEQEELSRTLVGATPRLIRGVAGCGKTAVLAAMAARYVRHRLEQSRQRSFAFLAETSEAPVRILVTCFNRSLVPFIRRGIADAYREQTGQDLPTHLLEVQHIDGLAWELSQAGLFEWISPKVMDATDRFRRFTAELKAAASAHPALVDSMKFDIAFVDEAQDFDTGHYEFLLQIVRPHPHTGEPPIILYYDDAQNIYARPRPVWKQLGLNVTGSRSSVMVECFRNTRPIVEFAFNVLMGSRAPAHARPALRQFADVHYLKSHGLVEEEEDWFTVRFAQRHGAPPIARQFHDRHDRTRWVVELIHGLVHQENVRFEDILVLATRQLVCREIHKAVERASQSWSQRPAGYLLPFGDNQDRNRYIFERDHLTISTVHGAKGYDAPVVLFDVTGLDAQTASDRAMFYVGATRAVMLLVVFGVRNQLLAEAECVARETHRRLGSG